MSNKLNGIFLVPTGISAKIGGDASCLAQVNLIASCCNKLLVNPNSVNASDINCMADNVLYVEGSSLDRFLSGIINLKETKTYNKILCVVNSTITPASINAVNAAIHTLGANITLLELTTPLILNAFVNEDGSASGEVLGWKELAHQVRDLDFDFLAIHTPINCPEEISNKYWAGEILVNPWGAVESKLSKLVSTALNKQAVHSPVEFLTESLFNKIVVKPSQAAEIISSTFAWCMFKGGTRAPKIDMDKDCRNLSNTDIDFMVSPIDCWGPAHEACFSNNIPIIIVRENTTCYKNFIYPKYTSGSSNLIFVNNYLEAAGIIQCLNAGIYHKIITRN